MKQLLYFGCIREAGHYLWQSEQEKIWRVVDFIPGLNPRLLDALDGSFAPGNSPEAGIYQESVVPPVRIVAWWDYSVDKRPGANSVLIGYDYGSGEWMLDDAVAKFPSVMKRQPRPVKDETTTKDHQ